jgi:4-amino-4-deoxy-L-arabinose transferase-like glycosyltransferase
VPIPVRFVPWLLVVWLAGSIVWVLPSFEWQLDYYKTPGPLFYQGILIAAPVVGLSSFAYAWIRRRYALQRVEPWMAAALAVPVLLTHPWALSVAVWVCVACYAVGRGALTLGGLPEKLDVEHAALGFAAGLALASCALFWIGLAGLFRPWVFAALALGACAAGRRSIAGLADIVRGAIRTWREDSAISDLLVGIGVFFSLLCGLSGVAVMLAPAIAYDAINYHLALAKSYAILGSLQGFPTEPYSFYPQGFEVLSSWAYSLGGIEAARVFAVLVFAVTLALCWSIGRRLGLNRGAAALGVMVASTMPAVHFTGVTVKNDVALAACQLGCLLCYLRWREDRRSVWFYLAMLLLAASFGVKHTAVFPAVALAFFSLHMLWKTKASRPRLLAGACVLWLFAAGVWHFRAVALTGDPTFPYSARSMTAASVRASDRVDRPGLFAVGVLASVPRFFFDLHRNGSAVYESILPAPVGIFLVLFLPAPLVARRRFRHGVPIVIFIFISIAIWAATMATLHDAVRADVTLRYVLPSFLLWPMLLTGPLQGLYAGVSRPFRGGILAAVAFSFVVPWTGLLIIENSGNQIQFLRGRMSESDYLAGALLPYRAIEAAARAAKPGDAALSFEGCAALYYPEPWKFRCRRTRDWSDPAAVLRSDPAFRDARFLILRNLPGAVDPPVRAERIYGDNDFVAYRVLQQAE